MSEIILHHYPPSPFAEKVRKILGLKGSSWRSVIVSNIMPRPDLMPLTGGYRKIPVMQIGADVYCDTQCIIRELERRMPEPTLFPNGGEGLIWGMSFWTDKLFFNASVGVVFGAIGDKLPREFVEDRAKFRGGVFDIERMKQALPLTRDQLRAYLDWAEQALSDGRPYLMGERPGLADVNVYFNVWFVRKRYPDAAAALDPFKKLTEWERRMDGLGHGERSDMEAAEALEVANSAEPQVAPAADEGDPSGRRPGDRVRVVPNDTGRDPVAGELIASSVHEIAIRRRDDRVGEVVVHFPRAGFNVLPA